MREFQGGILHSRQSQERFRHHRDCCSVMNSRQWPSGGVDFQLIGRGASVFSMLSADTRRRPIHRTYGGLIALYL